MRMILFSTGLVALLAITSCQPEDLIECIDPDGRSYETILIGNQIWMAENLAYLPAVSPSINGSPTEKHYYVYGYEGSTTTQAKNHSNYQQYGVLYNWEAALTACPDGWRLPSYADWLILEKQMGMET